MPATYVETCSVPSTFDFDVRVGLVFIAQAACVSAVAILGLFLYAGYNALQLKIGGAGRWAMTTHVHWYFLSLMFSDLIQAVGGMLNIRWITISRVETGSLCTAQGALKQVGDVGVALASLAIAVHTFFVIVFSWQPSKRPTLAISILVVIWAFLILTVSISYTTHKGKNYYGDTQYCRSDSDRGVTFSDLLAGCWITADYPAQRIALEYFWMWMTALLNILLYVPIALRLGGFFVVEGRRVRVLNWRARQQLNTVLDRGDTSHNIAVKMLFYPAVYTCTVLPIAIVRWRSFMGLCVPWAATVIADVIFASSGVLNVLLYSVTRPNLLPHADSTALILTRTSHSRPSHSSDPATPTFPAPKHETFVKSPISSGSSSGSMSSSLPRVFVLPSATSDIHDERDERGDRHDV
ncbi:hypothetical protein K474DRAFT_299653 [Panus rudis PR-1116 ss-1]|nr:hypothetical protein K474DRAFT_299653 [Panus rudis PR-1116 ss-1]